MEQQLQTCIAAS